MKLFITFDDFIKYFNLPDTDISFEEFKKKLTYRDYRYNENKERYNCYEYLKNNLKEFHKNNANKIIKIYYDLLIKNQKLFLETWFNLHIKITEKEFKNIMYYHVKNRINTNDNIKIIDGVYGQNKLKRVARNINFEDIYIKSRKTTNILTIYKVLKYLLEEWHLPYTSFIIPSSLKILLKEDDIKNKLKILFAIIRGTINNISIFNPYTSSIIFKFIKQGKKLFTPVIAWNSYQIGFYNSGYKHLVMCDVIENLKHNAIKLHNFYKQNDFFNKFDKKIDIFIKPSEKLYEINFDKEYKNYFDFIFFSPPYFDLELYSDDNKLQSTTQYKNYEDWLEFYWKQTCELCYDTINKNGMFSFVIIDNYENMNNKYYIAKDMFNIAKNIFKPVETIYIQWSNFSVKNINKFKKGNYEYLFLFRK